MHGDRLKQAIGTIDVIDKTMVERMSSLIPSSEVNVFDYNNSEKKIKTPLSGDKNQQGF